MTSDVVGCPFPPRPKAIGTLLTTDDFLPGAQTLLYSIKMKLSSSSSTKSQTKPPKSQPPQQEVGNNCQYEPEIIVIITPNVSLSVRAALHPAFCTRLIEVDPIPTPSSSSSTNSTDGGSHVSSWDINCGYTKLHIFKLDVYDRILYIDSDCLVIKDVSHLLQDQYDNVSLPHNNNDNSITDDVMNTERRKDPCGLIAAAPDIFPPDKFNAGVMLIKPSRQIFQNMMEKIPSILSYDGGDTGFLNAYYPHWYSGGEVGDISGGGRMIRRLPFGYNAQRFMYDCTFQKQPKYWNVAVIGGATDGAGDVDADTTGNEGLLVIHYSSSPKPWEYTYNNTTNTVDTKDDDNTNKSSPTSSSTTSSENNPSTEFLNPTDAYTISKTRLRQPSALDRRWKKMYERTLKFAKNYEEERRYLDEQTSRQKSNKRTTSSSSPTKSAAAAGGGRKRIDKGHSMVTKRFKELRKEGVGVKEAMATARDECGQNKNATLDPGSQVAAMFGMQI